MSKRAIVLAGGKGTRLRPYTDITPKPLMPIGAYPIIEIIIQQLAYYGFSHITIALNDRGQLIQKYVGNGRKWNIKVDYSEENTPLGTMGPLSLIPDLPEHFLIMNSDILTDINFSDFYDQHISEDVLFSISAFEQQESQAFGVLDVDEAGNLKDFREKPVKRVNVSMGIYMARYDILNRMPYNQPYGFDQLVHRLISEKVSPKVQIHQGYWLDIGCPKDYQLACRQFEAKPEQFLHSFTQQVHSFSK